ncbi:S8 family peptidase [Leptolyngbya ohadii]|uniref:S8 family peptidase n=1 Tax=Leptolyngbya ohadii TaxID=1962290 RepID=UPI000B59F220|nr:S8 family peptidase [Leptolyngbya ohadii]
MLSAATSDRFPIFRRHDLQNLNSRIERSASPSLSVSQPVGQVSVQRLRSRRVADIDARSARSSSSRSNRLASLRSNQRIQGVLKEGDPFSFGLSSFIDEYDLRGVKPGQQIEINLKSRQFDAYLELRDARTRRILLYGEDTDSFDPNARLVFTVQPGVRYQVRVSVSPNPILGTLQEGRYSLQSRLIPSTPGFNFFYGYGLVNAAAAVSQASGRSVSVLGSSGNANWGIDAIGAGTLPTSGFDGKDVIVAVLDTGVDYRHPDLVSNLWRNPGEIPTNGIDDDRNGFIDDVNGWDFVSQDNDPSDSDGHGTAVAGIIAASPLSRSPGIASGAKILPVRVLSDNEESGDSNSVADGIRYAIRSGAKVINMSLSSSPGFSLFQSLPENMAALREAQKAGVTVVMAAGNDREDFGALRPIEPGYAALQGLGIAVGAIDRNFQLADFSNPAGNRPFPFLVAPGVDLFATDRGGGYRADNSGTSFAVPLVSGVAALMLQANPTLTPTQIAAILIGTATRQGLSLYP